MRRDDLFISCDCLGPERSGPCYVLRQFIAPLAYHSGFFPSRAFSRITPPWTSMPTSRILGLCGAAVGADSPLGGRGRAAAADTAVERAFALVQTVAMGVTT